MKHKILIAILKFLRKIALNVQIGNPAGKAPAFTLRPGKNEKVFTLVSGSDTVSVWRLKNVICSGLYGGAVINKYNHLYDQFTSFPWGKNLHPSLSSPLLGKRSFLLEKAIFLITPEAKGNYYHWIADVLPRLALIKKSNLNDFHDRLIVLHNPSKSYENVSLSLFKINEEKIIRLNPFEFVPVSDLIIADLVGSEVSFPIWKRDILNEYKIEILKTTIIEKFKKIYLLRGRQHKRCLIGEERLVTVLKKAGFTIIDPQQMAFTDQVKTLAGAQIVVALHGASLTNIVFCKERTVIIELRSTHEAPEFYSQIARTYNLQFDSISLPPEQLSEARHTANKQNLIMTESSITSLMSKLGFYGE